MTDYIKSRLNRLLESSQEPPSEFISLQDFLNEFDYATKYLSRLLKVRSFVMYILLFKKAFFEKGTNRIQVKLSDIGANLLSDMGQVMSHEVVKRGISDLIHLKIVERSQNIKPGQINTYRIKLPSEIPAVQDMIAKEKNTSIDILDISKDDYFSVLENRLIILQRDENKCFYCLKDLAKSDFYLDHIHPVANGGRNYKSNLVACCKLCNTKKSDYNSGEFLIQNYRKGFLTQEEFNAQNEKLILLTEEYNNIH